MKFGRCYYNFCLQYAGDLEAQRDVTFEEAKQFADENGLMFVEASAKTGDGEKSYAYHFNQRTSRSLFLRSNIRSRSLCQKLI